MTDAEITPIDEAFATMEASDSDADRLRFYERVADAELYLLVEREPEDDGPVEPQLFEIDEGRFVLAFDRAERLAAFVGEAAPYAAMSGRTLVSLLAQEELGLGLNLEVAPSAYLLPADAMNWLAETLGNAPEPAEKKVQEVHPPGNLPEMLLTSLDAKLALMGAAAGKAYLARVIYDDGAQGHMLAFTDTAPGAESALTQAAAEALTFSGLDAGQLDVAFLKGTDSVALGLSRVALRFDLPGPAPIPEAPSAPGMDPSKPPKLL